MDELVRSDVLTYISLKNQIYRENKIVITMGGGWTRNVEMEVKGYKVAARYKQTNLKIECTT
jgi:hypothetical protein